MIRMSKGPDIRTNHSRLHHTMSRSETPLAESGLWSLLPHFLARPVVPTSSYRSFERRSCFEVTLEASLRGQVCRASGSTSMKAKCDSISGELGSRNISELACLTFILGSLTISKTQLCLSHSKRRKLDPRVQRKSTTRCPSEQKHAMYCTADRRRRRRVKIQTA